MASTALSVERSPRTRFPLAIAAILTVYLLGRIIEVLPFSTPSTPIVAIEIFSALAFAVVHGVRHYGPRGMLVFASLCLAIGGSMEVIGVHTGFPYGHYQFLPLMGPQVLRVPILLALAYIGMAYVSWIVARLIVGATEPRISSIQLIAIPLVASFVMTSWDFAQDPVWSTLLHAWRWRDGGAWFGVPLSNYAGWLLTVFLIYVAFAAYLHRRIMTVPDSAQWGAAVLFYALCALGNILQVLRPQPTEFVADNTGAMWRSHSILQASAIVSLLLMESFAMLAWYRARRNS
jgi:uncharacterized membrane protein